MKNNKKGMTLVECIIAMAVFAVATTGFTMAATTCIKAQIKSHTRNRIAKITLSVLISIKSASMLSIRTFMAILLLLIPMTKLTSSAIFLLSSR